MSAIKLTADSGGGSVALKGPATTGSNGNRELIVPDTYSGNGSLVTADSSGNVDLAGTLDVTGAAVFDSTASFAGAISTDVGIDLSGIGYSATQNAMGTTTAEILDHYEEGTWTPIVGGTATYTQQTADYTRIGRLITVRCDIIINTLGTGSTTTISGLPFAAIPNVTNGAGATNYCSGLAVSVGALSCYVSQNTANAFFTSWAGAGGTSTAINAAIFQDGARVQFAITYICPN